MRELAEGPGVAFQLLAGTAADPTPAVRPWLPPCTHLSPIVVQFGDPIRGAPGHCHVVPAAVCGGDAAQVVAQRALVLPAGQSSALQVHRGKGGCRKGVVNNSLETANEQLCLQQPAASLPAVAACAHMTATPQEL
jgi:hypothetical protein